MKKHVGGFLFCVFLAALALWTGYLDVFAQVAPGAGAGSANSGSVSPSGTASGNVTNNGTLTAGNIIIGDGTTVVKASTISISGGTITAPTNTAFTLATPDSNKNILFSPNGTGLNEFTKGLQLNNVSLKLWDSLPIQRANIFLNGQPKLALYSGTSGIAFDFNNNPSIYPSDSAGAVSDNTTDLGQPTAQFKDAYFAGSIYSVGSRVNYNLSVYAAGTAYSLTNTAAALDFGTTDPTKVIDKAGTYLILGRAYLKYNAATYAGTQTATIKLRRTNNTAADLPGATTTATLRVITTITDTVGIMDLPPVIYTTANTDDSISVFGSVSATPAAGSVDATEASIVMVRLY